MYVHVASYSPTICMLYIRCTILGNINVDILCGRSINVDIICGQSKGDQPITVEVCGQVVKYINPMLVVVVVEHMFYVV